MISRLILHKMIHISDKLRTENRNIHLTLNNFSENRVFNELWKNIAHPGRPQVAI